MNTDGIKIHSSSLPLFADLSAFQQSFATRSSSISEVSDTLLSLESLLDRDNEESISFKQYKITAIPFRKEFISNNVALISSKMDLVPVDSLSISKIFLVNTVDNQSGSAKLTVATMIPNQECLSFLPTDNISFIYKGSFSGTVLYSRLDGTFVEAMYYDDEPIKEFVPLMSDKLNNYDEEEIMHLYTVSPVIDLHETRARNDASIPVLSEVTFYGGWITESYCYSNTGGSNYDIENALFILGNNHCDNNEQGFEKNASSKGGGPVTGTKTKKSSIDDGVIQEEVLYVDFFLGSGPGGTTSGGGKHRLGATIFCGAIPGKENRFDRWTGDFATYDKDIVICAEKDIKTAAFFYASRDSTRRRPCFNSILKLACPLKNLRIAPTNSGLLENGVYGDSIPTRNSGHHYGIDLAAAVGTPIYAPCDGIISSSGFVTEQPDKKKINNKVVYVDSEGKSISYSGDKNAAGNRFSLKCKVDDETITFTFMHLQAGNAVGYNYRESRYFKENDIVYKGEIIGYTGITGNAYDSLNPHLHYEVTTSSGGRVDPIDYLNGSILYDSKGKPKADIEITRCDEDNTLNDHSNFYL